MRWFIAICAAFLLLRILFPKGFKRILSILELLLGIIEQFVRILFHLVEGFVRLFKRKPKPQLSTRAAIESQKLSMLKEMKNQLIADEREKIAALKRGRA